jgi:hypothetical protein
MDARVILLINLVYQFITYIDMTYIKFLKKK